MHCSCRCWPTCSCYGSMAARLTRSREQACTSLSSTSVRRSSRNNSNVRSANGGGNWSRSRQQRNPTLATRHFSVLSARDLGDETGDQALDLGRRQVVAGNSVRLAEIATNDEAAQPSARKIFCLRG